MKKILSLVFLLMIANCSFTQNIKNVTTFYGNNNFHLSASIIETESKLNVTEIKQLGNKTFERYPEQKGSVCTLLKNNNIPYAILYNYKRQVNIEKDTLFLFEDFHEKYKKLIQKFESIKSESPLQNHSIIKYYASLGSCGHLYDSNILTILSKDTLGNYYITYSVLCDNCSFYVYPIYKTSNGFERTFNIWSGLIKTDKIAKEIYQENGEDLVVKDLQYVKETDEKYIFYLINIK